MINPPQLIVITGPTGSGKTDLGIELARHFHAPVISADSRQLYRGMPIGTAQPTAIQLAQVPHYMIANHDITDDYSCGDYEQEALRIIEELFLNSPVVIAVGGSGLYIDALCYGMDDLPPQDPELRAELNARLASEGLDRLFGQLQLLDPEYAARVDRHNPQRVVRALEVCIQSGQPYSTLLKGKKSRRSFDIIKIGVTMERSRLYERINRRVDIMMEDGLLEEAKRLYPFRSLNSLQTVGYRELFDYFDGRLTLDEAVELIKRNSRRYAKRQLTWFNRDREITWFDPKATGDIIAHIENRLK